MITQTIEETWRSSHELPGFEISNTGRVRSARSGREVTVYGFGAKSYIKYVDRKGRKRQRNLWRVVYSLFGHNPVKLAVAATESQPDYHEEEVVITPETVVADTQPQARWADIEIETVLPGYRVSDLGEVMSPSGRMLTGSVYRSKSGWHDSRQVALMRIPGSGFTGALQMRVADLVAQHFLEARPDPTYDIEYDNGDFMDCRAVNLRWGQRGPRPSSTRTPSRTTKAVLASRALNKDPHWRLVQTPKIQANRYWVSDLGEVRGTRNVNLASVPYLNGGVGVNVKSSATGLATTVPRAQIVLEAFVGARPTGKHRPRHRNGDLTDCRLANLYWGVPGEDEPEPVPNPVPTPVPNPVPTPSTDDGVEVTILARYTYGGLSILINDDEVVGDVPPNTLENAEALGKIWARIAQDRQ